MTDRAPALRQSNFTDPAVSVAMRDIDNYIRHTLAWIEVPEFDALYTEPLFVALESEPVGIVCVRVRQVPQLGAPLVAGGVCPFVWDGARAQISKVPGLTAGTGTTYRFNFITVS